MALYCPQGSDTLCQQLTILHILHILHIPPILHSLQSLLSLLGLHSLHYIALSCTILPQLFGGRVFRYCVVQF